MTWILSPHSRTMSSTTTMATRLTTQTTTMTTKMPCHPPPAIEVSPRPPEEQFQSQQQVPQEVIPAPTPEPPVPGDLETEPTEPGPLDCREEQYPCTRLYSIHKPCKQCLNEVCFYSLRRVYVVNKEICVRTVCAHEELLRADLCRDKFSKCGVMAVSGLCQSVAASCARSCGGC
ncbi:microfibrillar-associated protein 2 isoform X2 [Arvicola amphibius]|uniref:microfibrillar-associated protein 2 isoform X2 n=1 Tax=Arvicola amphibius TaxID=1047088 RepID=UPI0018E34C7B|nr:microfibrillar-associated protein 2 isoform X2 [Arvicola amphibius]